MSKHTPGPWRFEPSSPIHNPLVYLPDGGELEVVTDNDADARLIAAAPDLLAALNDLLNDVGRASSMLGAIKARAAIAKATGSQP